MRSVLLLIFWSTASVVMSQNVGIGTTNPQQKLHVVSADSIAVQVESSDLNSSTAAVGISIRPTSNTSFQWLALKGREDAFVVNSARLYLNRRYDNDVRTLMFVDEYGQVGIGGTESDIEYAEPAKLNILQKGVPASGLFLEAPFVRDGIVIKGLTSNLYPNPAAQKVSAIRFGFNQLQNSRITVENRGSTVNPLLSFEMYNITNYNYEKVLTLERTGVVMNKTLGVQESLTVVGNALLYNNLSVAGNSSVAGDLTVTNTVKVSGDAFVTGNLYAGTLRPFVDVDVPANTIKEVFCGCPNGLKAIGGGGGHRDYNTAAQDVKINFSGPDLNDDSKWRMIVTNNNLTQMRAVRVFAICTRLQ